ncbi:LLM class flavin-dependent oxidoreductase [Baekduia soli]|uniref:LLM class flavin-dependent oxidoreductase n=1 Tax=Baekduia soli TaxID=496014 RepID=A0A5B8TZG3_9ACTN|nr:LLM class flavin-dependent oxidoreductase [Baekduia soli]QEC46114.1 LLM class flavin-dependent oxidoreductase [Baekduia soli]
MATAATPPVGLLFTGAPAIPEMVALARQAEDRGFDSIWIAETRMTRDAFVPAAAIAQVTERVRIGTGIVNVYTRNPVVLAISFLGLDELAPGRILAGLGTGSPRVLAPQGVPFHRPLTRLREYCEVLPPLMRGEPVSYDGTTVTLDGARIEDVLAAGAGTARAELPLWLAATGPKAMRYAGGVADGMLMNVCLPTTYVESRLELLEAGARDAGRTLDDVEVAMAVLTCADDDEQAARDAARRFIGLYLGAMPNIAQETGLPQRVLDDVGNALAGEGLEAAARLVPEEAIDLLAAAGTPEQCRRRLDAYREAGIDLVVLTPLEGTIGPTIDLMAPVAG